MPRGGDRDRGSKRSAKDTGRRTKKKVCIFCKDHIDWVDYKDVNLLRKFMSDRGKIRARRVSGNCAQHQRDVAVAIKTARELALLPYSQRTMTERSGRGGRGAPRPVVPRVERDAEATAGPGGRPADTAGPGGRPADTAGPGGPPEDAGAAPAAPEAVNGATGREAEPAAAPVGADARSGGDQ